MSRLLYAAARGARIQGNYQGVWSGVAGVHLGETKYEYRVHPDDAHLQYGRISTKLRESAENTNSNLSWSVRGFMEMGAICAYTAACRSDDWRNCLSDLQRSLFLLILSEVIADDGL
jgi:hypothetical protein